MRQALLVSAAAIALTAASTLAYAQGTPNAAPGGGAAMRGEGTAPAAAPGTPTGQITQTPEPGKATQDRTLPEKQKSTQQTPAQGTGRPQSTEAQQHQQPTQRSVEGAESGGSKQGAAGQQPNGQKSAERPMTSKNVSLTNEQRTTIRTKVLTNSAPRVTNVNFDLKVGTAVPRTVRIVPLPSTIVEIEPTWRGYLYFVHNDQIIVVEPRTLEIVAVLDV